MSKQQTFGATDFFRPEWADTEDTSKFIERELLKGEVLNFPCGESRIGDVRADADESVNPDVVADINDPPFKEDSFDTVYCDPPYSMHAFDKNQWALKLWDVAKERLILQTTTQTYRFPNGSRTVYFADRRWAMTFQVIQVFDRESARISDYSEAKA